MSGVPRLDAATAAWAALWLAVALTSVVYVSARIAARVTEDPLERWTAGILLALAQPVAIGLAAGSAGLLAPVPVLIAHLALAVVVARLVRSDRPAEGARRPPPGLVALGAFFVLAAVAPAALGRSSSQQETRHYHVANMAHLVDDERLWGLAFQNPAFATATHPGNGELLGAWLSLPTHGDEVAYHGNLVFGALAVLGTGLLARRLGGTAGAGALAGLAVVAAPIVLQKNAFGLATDLAAAGPVVAALALVHRARDERAPVWLGLAGIALGLGVGAKYTAIAPAALVAGFAIVTVRPRRAVAWLLPGLMLLAGPWFLRNALATGNPVFPQEVAFFGREVLPGYDSPLEAFSRPLLSYALALDGSRLAQWLGTVWRLWGPAILAVPIGLVGGGLAAIMRRRGLLGVTLLTALGFVAFTALQFTGEPPLMGSNSRYLLPVAMWAAAIAAAALPAGWVGAASLGVIGYGAWEVVFSPKRPELGLGWGWPLVLAAAAAAPFVWSAAARFVASRRPTVRWGVLALAISVGAGGVLGMTAWRRVPSDLEEAAWRVRSVGQPFIVVGVFDLRSVLGPRLDAEQVTLSAGGAAGETPYTTAAEFQAALDASDADVLIVGLRPNPSIPAGWSVPAAEWCDAGGSAHERVYLRRSAGGC